MTQATSLNSMGAVAAWLALARHQPPWIHVGRYKVVQHACISTVRMKEKVPS